MYLAPRPATPINLVDVIRTIGNCSNVYSAAQRKLTGGGAHVVLRPWKLATRPHSRARRRLQAAARQRLDSDHSAACVSTRAGACSLSGSSESWPRSALYTFPAGRDFSGYYPSHGSYEALPLSQARQAVLRRPAGLPHAAVPRQAPWPAATSASTLHRLQRWR